MTDQGRVELEGAIAQLLGDVATGEPTVAEQREGYDKFGGLMPMPDDAVVTETTLGGVTTTIVDNTGDRPDTTILYLHGGGYVIGSYLSHQGFLAALSKIAHARVALVHYRLAPEDPYPAAVEDAVAAYNGLLHFGGSPSKIVVSGDSAGGGLGLATLVKIRDNGDPRPAGGVFFSPWTDLAITGASVLANEEIDTMVKVPFIQPMADMYVGTGDPRDPLISPVYADLTGLPPLALHVGSDEILLDDSRRIAEHAASSGVECSVKVWPKMLHVFPTYAPLLPEGHLAWRALAEVGFFVQSVTAG